MSIGDYCRYSPYKNQNMSILLNSSIKGDWTFMNGMDTGLLIYFIKFTLMFLISFYPTFRAYRKRKKNKLPILVLNLFAYGIGYVGVYVINDYDSNMGNAGLILLGIAFLIWLVPLIWSLLYEKKEA